MFTLSENTTVKAKTETGGHAGPRKGARQSSERLFWCEGKVRRRGRTTQSSLCAFSMTCLALYSCEHYKKKKIILAWMRGHGQHLVEGWLRL